MFTKIAQRIKISIKDFFSTCDQIRIFLRTWSHLMKKSFKENFVLSCSEKRKVSSSKPWILHPFLLSTNYWHSLILVLSVSLNLIVNRAYCLIWKRYVYSSKKHPPHSIWKIKEVITFSVYFTTRQLS